MRSLLVSLTLIACSGGKDDSGDISGIDPGGSGGGSGGGSAECATDDECEAGQICEAQACVDGDRDNSATEASAILWEDSATGVINPLGDVDWYSFVAEGGEFVRIDTVTEWDYADTAITLRDSSGKVVARVDDYPTGGSVNSYDSVLYAYLATAGTYTIEVEDVGSFYGSAEGNGDPDYAYTLALRETGSHTEDDDSFEDPSYDVDIESGSTLYPIGVALEADGDIDYAQLDHTWAGGGLYILGLADMGGSDADPRVSLYDEDGGLLLTQSGIGPDGLAFFPYLDDDQYILALDDADGDGGESYWFYVFLIAEDEEDAYPLETEPNDTEGTETAIDQDDRTTDSGSEYTIGYIQGTLDPDGDVDRFLFEGFDDGRVVLCLNSSVYGSCVAPNVEIYDSTGALVGEAEGDDGATDGNTVIENLEIDDGDYTLVVRGPDGGDYGADAWYRLILYVASFDVESYSCP